MTEETFMEVFKDRVNKCQTLLISKNLEYARDGDKLSNFKKAAALQGCCPEKALQGMMAKHQISISDMINDLNDDIYTSMEIWEEKLNDALNYLFLLDALLEERRFAIKEELNPPLTVGNTAFLNKDLIVI
jgi:hypothetical protein